MLLRYKTDQTLCGGPRYGNSSSRSPCGPTLSPATFPFVNIENVDNIVGQCPAIVRKARRGARVIGKNIPQHSSFSSSRHREKYCGPQPKSQARHLVETVDREPLGHSHTSMAVAADLFPAGETR